MSLVDEAESKSVSRGLRDASVSRRVLAAYPGEEVKFAVNVRGPQNHTVSIRIGGIPSSVASVKVLPDRAVAPYTATVDIRVHPDAKPGLYPFEVLIEDETEGTLLGSEPLALLVLPRILQKAFAKEYTAIVDLYKRRGAMWMIWYLLSRIFTNGATFTQLKEAYDLVAGKTVSKGTVSNILRRMIRKKLIQRDASGLYRALVTDESVVDSRIDERRVRIQTGVNGVETVHSVSRNAAKLPYSVRLAWQRALKIAQIHGSLAAMYFLVHTVLGARETGYLLYWGEDDWFITCENKTGFCHHFSSEYVEQMLRELGIRPGVMYREDEQHRNARRIAYRYIHKYYGSFANARRVHYELKQYNLIDYDEDVYVVEIIHYADGDVGVRIWDQNREKLIAEENVEDKPVKNREIRSAFPYEHEDPKNEETYFHRPAGLY